MEKRLAERLMTDMGIGWNLGNTFDAAPDETSWGNPRTERAMLEKIASYGFKTLRLPVSWSRHVDAEYNIDPAFLERVAEAAGYSLDAGLYTIVNIHHDNHLFRPTAEGFEGGKVYIRRIWEQLSERFGGFGQKLIFESMNEPRMLRHKYEWNLDLSDRLCLDAIEYINRYNEVFVETVRASGGNNSERFLMTPSYAAAPHHTFVPAFRVPSDPSDRIIVSVHSYQPVPLCLLEDPAVNRFGEAGERELDFTFKKLNECFVSKGIPVVIGEMGIINKNNPDDRRRWGECFVGGAIRYGMVPVWWDNGGRDFRLFDRRRLCIYDDAKPVFEGLLKGAGL